VTVGTMAENEKFIAALEKVIKSFCAVREARDRDIEWP
jgi:hypothetical protein